MRLVLLEWSRTKCADTRPLKEPGGLDRRDEEEEEEENKGAREEKDKEKVGMLGVWRVDHSTSCWEG